MKLPPWLSPLLRGLAVVLVVVLGRDWLRKVDWAALGAAVWGARPGPLLLAGLLTLANTACVAERWRLMLRPAALLPRWRTWQYLTLSFALCNFLPARGGEALRVYLPQRRHGVPAPAGLSVILIERVFDWQGMLAIYLPLPLLLPLPRAAKLGIALVAGAALVAMIVLVGVATHLRNPQAHPRWARLATGLSAVRAPGTYAAVLGWSIGQYAIEVLQIALVLHAVGVHGLPWAAPGLVLLTLNLALVVPLAPGHLGTFEAGVTAGLHFMGAPLPQAMAAALILHGVQMVPMLLAGLSGLPVWLEAA